MNRKGFTLVELLMVVIIIGILVTLAVPNYYRSVERAKAGKGKAAADAIRKAQLQYRAFQDTYTDTIDELSDYDLPPDLWDGTDADWTYEITVNTESLMDVTCTRDGGPNDTSDFVMDQDGVLDPTNSPSEWGIQ